MFWNDRIPRRRFTDASGKHVDVTVIAGALGDVQPLAPPPHSWGADPDADLAIWSIAMEDGATWTVPPARGEQDGSHAAPVRRQGTDGRRHGHPWSRRRAGACGPSRSTIEASRGPIEVLLLQGRPIGEPVAQYGPFVMNTRAELEQAFADYRRTQFGGWPFPDNAPVHPQGAGALREARRRPRGIRGASRGATPRDRIRSFRLKAEATGRYRGQHEHHRHARRTERLLPAAARSVAAEIVDEARRAYAPLHQPLALSVSGHIGRRRC